MNAFPKAVRLRHALDFRRTLDHGAKAVSPLMVLFLTERPDNLPTKLPADGGPRLGLIVSKKVGGSVVRNLVKRRLREAYRHLRPVLAVQPALQGIDLVVVARANAAEADAAAIASALEHCVKRLARQLGAARESTGAT